MIAMMKELFCWLFSGLAFRAIDSGFKFIACAYCAIAALAKRADGYWSGLSPAIANAGSRVAVAIAVAVLVGAGVFVNVGVAFGSGVLVDNGVCVGAGVAIGATPHAASIVATDDAPQSFKKSRRVI